MERTIKIELTKEQMENLLVFLNRAELKGSEVGAFVEIIQAMNKKETPKQ